ncbi:leucine aminopeptidase-like protein [Emericellopsis cladophorae]|uniref:Peptide hydrolase n=1 Tax=Emericellopsis cladophorae TaxID=2686198 RepID=A0A9Q0BIG5_9HYPO|nr:leucine aminopeptidase-like protein [Emericellopsis cladophorae]KAI6785599.1 leucine aminopeptidase-like protein [Emericellopsis cladophorae]
MVFKAAIAALAASAQLASAFEKPAAPAQGMRLIKSSEEDPGQWIFKEDKYTMVKSKRGRKHYIDITNIEDDFVLERLSAKNRVAAQKAIEYPDTLGHVDEAQSFISSAGTEGPQLGLKHLTSGTEAANRLFKKVQDLASANAAITVEQFPHSDFDQPSVLARIPGKSENLVIIGAHFDSAAGKPSAAAPGADDNATGMVVVLESFRVLAQGGFEPENTLEFHWYGGEEIGLVGSADVFAHYRAAGKTVLSYVNQDMAGYSPSGTPAIITDYTDSDLNAYVKLLVTEYTGQAPNEDACGYGCSDHASADANGFPAAFLFEDFTNQTSPYIHTVNDTLGTIMWDAVERHIQFSIGYLVEASYL